MSSVSGGLRIAYEAPGVLLLHGDCREWSGKADVLFSDPPYPNNAGHFDDGIEAARGILKAWTGDEAAVFWTEMEQPPCCLPLVAVHVWHRSNTNRPDNYEPVFWFNRDGRKRASRVLSYPVVYPGLTGCVEATGHPTQKPEKLAKRLLEMLAPGTVLDPFCGSGTTLIAALETGRKAIGVEIDARWVDVAKQRLERWHAQGRLDFGTANNAVSGGAGAPYTGRAGWRF